MKTRSFFRLVVLASLVGIAAPLALAIDTGRLRIHEWGTFTVLQSEAGIALPGVNINEEALPVFVRRLGSELAPDNQEFGPLLYYSGSRGRSKGIARSYGGAIMRMETPIIYFHPPAGWPADKELDVSVDFNSGWITEWYPNATKFEAPGYDRMKIDPNKPGSISWNGLRLGQSGAKAKVPATDYHVWLAPRKVGSPLVTTAAGQSEHYLFYRGVANLVSPVRVEHARDGDTLKVYSDPKGGIAEDQVVPHLWLADIGADGAAAFREFAAATLPKDTRSLLFETPAKFGATDYSSGELARLRKSMRSALITKGLFEDEAEAMLNTWELSYFKSPGLRLFYVLPDQWTNRTLPLRVSEPADTVRAMIGRIELVTPAQRELLAKIAGATKPSRQWFDEFARRYQVETKRSIFTELLSGKRTLADYELEIPADYQAYIDLGRFRDALVIDASKANPGGPLTRFVQAYGIRGFTPNG